MPISGVMAISSHLAGLAGAALRVQADERLGLLACEGHQRAFEELVHRHRAPLVAYASAIVGFDQAQDVVQEAFARLDRALVDGQAPMQVRPWLYTVVRNRALTLIRDERQHDQLDESYDGVPQPPDIAMRREELSNLVAQIKDLPEDQRGALVGRELEGRSHAEIGAALGVSAASARGLIFRARTVLRNGAGCVIPLPLLRGLLETGSAKATVAAAGSGAAGGLAGGGSAAALAVKGATVLAGVAALLAGSSMVLEGERDVVAAKGAGAAAPVDGGRAHVMGGRDDGDGTREHERARADAPAKGRNDGQADRRDGPNGPDPDGRKPGTSGSPSAGPPPPSETTTPENADEASDDDLGDDPGTGDDEFEEAEDDDGSEDDDVDDVEIDLDREDSHDDG